LDTGAIESDDAVVDDGDELCIDLLDEECPIGALSREAREEESERYKK
jgi:hypothetical protein